jgi:hypothetical protein
MFHCRLAVLHAKNFFLQVLVLLALRYMYIYIYLYLYEVQIMDLLIMQNLPVSCNVLHVTLKYLPQQAKP